MEKKSTIANETVERGLSENTIRGLVSMCDYIYSSLDQESEFSKAVDRISKLNSIEEPLEEAYETNEKSEESTTSETIINEAKPIEEANMQGVGGIKDQDPNIVNLGSGVEINLSKINIPTAESEALNNLAQRPGIPNSNPFIIAMESGLEKNNANQIPPIGLGRHKIDNPSTKKPIVEKAKPDNITVDIEGLEIPVEDPVVKEMPDIISSVPARTESIEEVIIPKFDNSYITSKYRYMADIEKLALDMGIQILMQPRQGSNGQECGLINCIVYTPESPNPNVAKGFTIDTGCIIDRRAKMFPTIIPAGYEDVPAYPVLVPKDGDKHGKSKNVLNEQLFRDMLVGGVLMLDKNKSMYTKDFMQLNKCVALITMPTNNMNKETRVAVRERLMAAMKDGVFAAIHEKDSKSRFMFKSYSKKDQSFVLTNEGVPFRYCDICRSINPIEIVFDADGKTIVNYLHK